MQLAYACFAGAIIHTFLAGRVRGRARWLFGQVEYVFALWSLPYILSLALQGGAEHVWGELRNRAFTEALFVFVILAVCSTRPILDLASSILGALARLLPFKPPMAFYLGALTAGPLLGSFITEPAAMTLIALLLRDQLYAKGISTRFKYATLGLLFVNVSIGGTLTPFAAPPVLMVATDWGWDLSYMLAHFGWRAALAIALSTGLTAYRFRKEIHQTQVILEKSPQSPASTPAWLRSIHFLFLGGIVLLAHHAAGLAVAFLAFAAIVRLTQSRQPPIELEEAFAVGLFLAGLIVLGSPQRGWLEPVLLRLQALPLYLSAIGLTAVVDNAALTYLGAQVPDLSEVSRYALVAGSVVGGGLTLIANAPNPAGYRILKASFGEEGISPWGLFKHAALPTSIAALCYWAI